MSPAVNPSLVWKMDMRGINAYCARARLRNRYCRVCTKCWLEGIEKQLFTLTRPAVEPWPRQTIRTSPFVSVNCARYIWEKHTMNHQLRQLSPSSEDAQSLHSNLSDTNSNKRCNNEQAWECIKHLLRLELMETIHLHSFFYKTFRIVSLK